MEMQIDHLVYVAPDLQLGIQMMRDLFGVAPVYTGQHPAMGYA